MISWIKLAGYSHASSPQRFSNGSQVAWLKGYPAHFTRDSSFPFLFLLHFYDLLHIKEFLLHFLINVVSCFGCQWITFHVRRIFHECFSFFVSDHYFKYMQNDRDQVRVLLCLNNLNKKLLTRTTWKRDHS